MPPKKKDELKQIVPIYSADNVPPLFWKYQQYSPEERQQFDAFFVNFQKELSVKMTENIYQNMEFQVSSIGSRINPLFKQASIDQSMDAKTLKEIELEEQKKQQTQVDLAKSQKNLKNQPQPQADPKNSKKEELKPVATGKEDPKKNPKKEDGTQQNIKDLKKATEIELIENEEEVKQELPPYFLMTNQRIDYLTMKMVLFQLPFTNITTIKQNHKQNILILKSQYAIIQLNIINSHFHIQAYSPPQFNQRNLQDRGIQFVFNSQQN